MVGEIRDSETAEIAIRSALTGHLVLSSLHTNDAPESVVRLTDMGYPALPHRFRRARGAGPAARAPGLHLLPRPR
jgi:Tfp pilus assembly pilus retraction ATPase PilT